MLVSSFGARRLVTTRALVERYASCPLVAEVVITHSGPEDAGLQQYALAAPRCRLVEHPGVSFNNRFKPVAGITTRAVLATDDDMEVDCYDLRAAMEAWFANPHNIVGFYGRLHTIVGSLPGILPIRLRAKGETDQEYAEYAVKMAVAGAPSPDGHRYRYNGWWRVEWRSEYSFVLPTKAGVFHKRWLRHYSETMPEVGAFKNGRIVGVVHSGILLRHHGHVSRFVLQAVRAAVDIYRQCEDIAMAFLVANETESAPMLVRGSVTDHGIFNGVSTKAEANMLAGGVKHFSSRSDCLNTFAALFGRMPLIPSHVMAGDIYSAGLASPVNFFDRFSADMFSWS